VLPPVLRRNRNASSPLSWKRRLLLGAVWFVLLAPSKALAGLVEYALILALIAILVTIPRVLPPGSTPVLHELQSAVTGAQAANASGNQRQELSHLSKALGLEEALMDMAASCDTCGDVKADLQELIGLTSKLRARVLITPGCKPDGVIAANEECDPLAVPTGCPTDPVPTFCNDMCQCEEVATTTTTPTSSTTSTTLCAAGATDCAGTCVDLTSDANNCGSCGTVCPPATPVCIGSVCTIP
jgi:Flp pilus assembly pilin Flp